MKKLIPIAFVLLSMEAGAQCSDIFFSEYLEGSSNNKALEIYNPTSAPINLTDYVIYRANNGSPTAQDSLFPQDVLAPGDVWVAGNPSAVATILAASDTLHTITFFNGDDALWIKKISTGTTIDVIGQLGFDPGTNWPVGTGATSEFTLVRMFSIQQGNTNWTTAANEYDVFAQNTDSTLGHHYMQACCIAPTLTLSSQTDNLCFGDANGSIQVAASGSGPFTYEWINRPETTATISGLPAGTYTAVVTGSCGTDTLTATITEPALLTQTLTSSTNPGCLQTDGSLGITVTGGTAPYTYMWSNGGVTASISNLGAGAYTCTVICTNGCTSVMSYTLQNTSPAAVSVTLSMDTLCQTNSGPFALTGESPAGGTWSGSGVNGSTFYADSANAGWNTITYTYTDSNNCVGTAVDSIFVDVCAGISALNGNGFSISPNPFSNEFHVTFSVSGIHTVEVFNIHGDLIKSFTTAASQTTVDMNDAAEGMYIVRVYDGTAYKQVRVIRQ